MYGIVAVRMGWCTKARSKIPPNPHRLEWMMVYTFSATSGSRFVKHGPPVFGSFSYWGIAPSASRDYALRIRERWQTFNPLQWIYRRAWTQFTVIYIATIGRLFSVTNITCCGNTHCLYRQVFVKRIDPKWPNLCVRYPPSWPMTIISDDWPSSEDIIAEPSGPRKMAPKRATRKLSS